MKLIYSADMAAPDNPVAAGDFAEEAEPAGRDEEETDESEDFTPTKDSEQTRKIN
jgi:hypothetical protein